MFKNFFYKKDIFIGHQQLKMITIKHVDQHNSFQSYVLVFITTTYSLITNIEKKNIEISSKFISQSNL